MAARRHLEDDAACALIAWRDLHVRRYPELGLLIHIPQGGKRSAREGARFKRMGVRAGVSDYLLPVPMRDMGGQGWIKDGGAGLWIELKAGKGKPTPAQLEWLRLMAEQGYATQVATGWVEAARAIASYLGIDGIAP